MGRAVAGYEGLEDVLDPVNIAGSFLAGERVAFRALVVTTGRLQ